MSSPEQQHQDRLRTAALDYARRGWRVLPLYEPDPTNPSGCCCGNTKCRSAGKHPRIPGGHNNATIDPNQIDLWWRRWPNANVGIATGDGLLVLDVDPRNGGNGSLADLEQEFDLPSTRTVRTGSGGQHFYFEVTEEVRGASSVRAGIDIKAEGGYVVAPPSLHPEGEYAVESELDPVRAPTWLTGLRGLSQDEDPAPALYAARLAALAAPGATPEERAHWAREAVECIPNDGHFDDRTKWVGMAYSIDVACGSGAEHEAFEIFDDFSARWDGGPYEPDETRRVWETRRSAQRPGGYPHLLSLARSNGYTLAEDHPLRPERVFDISVSGGDLGQPSRLQSTLNNAKCLDWAWERLPEILPHAHAAVAELPPNEAAILEGFVLGKIAKLTKSSPRAERIWERFGPTDAGVEVVRGKEVIRAEDPSKLDFTTRYLVQDLIPVGEVGELIADHQMGKTWVLLSISLSVAFGVPFLGHEVARGRVLYLAYEGQKGLWERMAGWLHANGFIDETFTKDELAATLDGRVIVAELPPDFGHPKVKELIRDTVLLHDVQLVVVDTRAKSLGPTHDENGADTAAYVMGMMSVLAKETGCTFVSAHHTGQREKGRGRGSSAWTQAADFTFIVKGTQQSFAAGGEVELQATKFRSAKRPRPLHYKLKAGVSLRMGGEAMTSAVIERVEPGLGIPPYPLKAGVFDTIQANPGCSKKSLREKLRSNGLSGSNTSIDKAVEELIELGAVHDDGGRHGHLYSAVPGWKARLFDGELRGPTAHPESGPDSREREPVAPVAPAAKRKST